MASDSDDQLKRLVERLAAREERESEQLRAWLRMLSLTALDQEERRRRQAQYEQLQRDFDELQEDYDALRLAQMVAPRQTPSSSSMSLQTPRSTLCLSFPIATPLNAVVVLVAGVKLNFEVVAGRAPKSARLL